MLDIVQQVPAVDGKDPVTARGAVVQACIEDVLGQDPACIVVGEKGFVPVGVIDPGREKAPVANLDVVVQANAVSPFCSTRQIKILVLLINNAVTVKIEQDCFVLRVNVTD